jgi:hypothetical protein
MLRSVVAVVVGFFVIAALAIGTDMLVRLAMPAAFDAAFRTNDLGVLLLTLAYVGVYATFGCWLCARLAPSRPMRHAMILGLLGLAFNVLGTVKQWGTAPAWYLVVSLLLVLPYAWLGGWIRERQLAVAASATSPATA